MSDDLTSSSSIQCIHCGKSFNKHRGLKIHISRVHPAQHRECLTTIRPTKPEDILNEIELQPISKSQVEDTFTQELNTWRTSFSSDMSDQAFDDLINQFLIFLASAIHRLPGPKHPAARYYEARRKK